MLDIGESELTFFGAGRENLALREDLGAAFARVMATNQILNGPDVYALEAEIAEIAGRKHGIAVNSATDALFFMMTALGIGQGDEVLVPAFGFVASAEAVARTGAKAVFVDVYDWGGSGAVGTLDLEKAKDCITLSTKALLWVGMFGALSDPIPIKNFAETHGLFLLEDAAQSFGASFGDHKAGQLGIASAFSFDRNKVLGAPGTGGMVVTDDPDMNSAVRALRYHGIEGGAYGRIGYNSQMSSVTAAVLLIKLAHHKEWMAERQRIATVYDAACPGEPLRWSVDLNHARHKYVLLSDRRDALKTHLAAHGVPTRNHYATPVHQEPVFGSDLRLPVAEDLTNRALSLPIFAQITDAELDRVTQALESF